MNEDEFFSGTSKPRNKGLMRVFRDIKLVEQLGSGMFIILKKYDKSIFKISDNFIRITFPFENINAEKSDRKTVEKRSKAGRKTVDNITKIEIIILEYIEKTIV